ncbi:enoyl-CoA hydratase/isomerase family protein [Vreelandella rituensis]|uniref:Enoyl-CoA hydratase/isomerase family protein n=1 Tax=Vreelandella rituensis TaxID=2282306 RepID=A0A368TUG7_9GAMM|nr:enoyl-CoA hydratase/isomerase family protein [Halomonas rituensis]RCV88334.1 enoyl-CoA hydratase/isomerase family protein [Halomonas rituensis]
MSAPVHYRRIDEIGVICIDNPPVNALSQAVRAGLLATLKQGLKDTDAKALVIMAKGRTFIAGADIREFGKPAQSPLLPEVITQLEASPKPIIAVLHGTALGGGLEVALGCHLRVALPDTLLGLPEVKLGLLPGAGGTQRLPRLVGIEAALDMITSGRFVNAEEAHELGIIDIISETSEPLQAGLAAASDVLAGKRETRVTGQLPTPDANPAAVADFRVRLADEAPALFSPFRCIDAVEASAQGTLDEGLKRERELFLLCMESPQRNGLIHSFFAARNIHKVPQAEEATPLLQIALIGKHPLFERLQQHAKRAGITFSTTITADTQACLLAPGDTVDNDIPDHCITVSIIAADTTDMPQTPLALVLSPNLAVAELVALTSERTQQQAVANALKALRQPVVVSQGNSMLSAMTRAIKGRPVNQQTKALEAISHSIAENELCYRVSDIDLLAIEGLEYPRHLGGPHYQATLPASSRVETS